MGPLIFFCLYDTLYLFQTCLILTPTGPLISTIQNIYWCSCACHIFTIDEFGFVWDDNGNEILSYNVSFGVGYWLGGSKPLGKNHPPLWMRQETPSPLLSSHFITHTIHTSIVIGTLTCSIMCVHAQVTMFHHPYWNIKLRMVLWAAYWAEPVSVQGERVCGRTIIHGVATLDLVPVMECPMFIVVTLFTIGGWRCRGGSCCLLHPMSHCTLFWKTLPQQHP